MSGLYGAIVHMWRAAIDIAWFNPLILALSLSLSRRCTLCIFVVPLRVMHLHCNSAVPQYVSIVCNVPSLVSRKRSFVALLHVGSIPGIVVTLDRSLLL